MKILQIIDLSVSGRQFIADILKARPFADMIWLRMKNIDAHKMYLHSANAVKAAGHVPVIISDRADVASAAGAHGVHLNSLSLPPCKVKRAYPSLSVSYSAHSTDEIKQTPGCDFYTLSPLFMTKKDYDVIPIGPVDVSGMEETVFGLGGIKSENASFVKDAGYAGIAGISFLNNLEGLKKILLRF